MSKPAERLVLPPELAVACQIAWKILPRVAGFRSPYSIRIADRPGSPCARCSTPTGHGPIGDYADSPLCDRCVFEECRELGMVLALISMVREFAAVDRQDIAAHETAVEELADFAEIYDRFAAAWGPPRPFEGLPRNHRRSNPPPEDEGNTE